MREEYRHLSGTAENSKQALERLTEILRILRKECPWDREQDHRSLRSCMIEEAYEVAEAIDNSDGQNLKEELGDVILQVVFHSLLAEESGEFDLTDVINGECEKMIRRHPHVFNDEGAKDLDKVLEKWENIKVKEHRQDSYAERLRSVPRALPALIRSHKIQKKAADVGFDWDVTDDALEKIVEEAKELKGTATHEERTEELGDLLFSVVNVSRFIGVEPEAALEAATDKFVARFKKMEDMAEETGKKLEQMTLGEMDRLWDEAKTRDDQSKVVV